MGGTTPSGNSSSGTPDAALRIRSDDTSDSAPYSSDADDKTIHETYLWSWYDIVKNGVGAVMCAMTEVNNTAACEDSDLLMGLLKTEIGFPGMLYLTHTRTWFY